MSWQPERQLGRLCHLYDYDLTTDTEHKKKWGNSKSVEQHVSTGGERSSGRKTRAAALPIALPGALYT